jgi:hypothetical protein
MRKKRQFLTPFEEIALNLAYNVVGESGINRTRAEYVVVAAKLPVLKVLTHKVNEQLKWMHQRSAYSGVPLPLLCRFNAGDQRYSYEEYPRHISYQTVRTALNISGLRTHRGSRTNPL